MEPHISIQIGLDPWEPAIDAKQIEVYSKYDVPLSGIISQSDQFYVFRCIRGELEVHSLWVYAWVDENELKLLDRAEDLELVINRITTGRPLTVVLSDQTDGIMASWLIPPMSFSIFDSEAITRAAQEHYFTVSMNLTALISSLQ